MWCEHACVYITKYWEHLCAQWAVWRQQWDYSSWCNHYFLFGCWGRETCFSAHVTSLWLHLCVWVCVTQLFEIWWLIIWHVPMTFLLHCASAVCSFLLTLLISLSYDQVTHKDCYSKSFSRLVPVVLNRTKHIFYFLI